jgi:SHS2 domain-containing protein
MARNMDKYRFIEHTGDLGMEVFGADLPGLFENAAEGLFDIITDPGTIREKEEREISLEAGGLEELLIRWLTEFIFLFDVEFLLFRSFHILSLDGGKLRAIASGERFDEERHPFKTTVKAATYHQLKIEQVDGIWKARIIFDL